MKDLFKNYIYPIATLSGSIIGVGFLSLPYITLKIGIWPMLFYMVVLCGLVVLIHVIFGQISLKTPDHKRFPGFVGFYLGKPAKIITLVSLILGQFGVLLAYLIVGSQFLMTLVSPFLVANSTFFVWIYCIVVSVFVYFGIKAVSRVELWALVLLLIALVVIGLKSFSKIHVGNIFSGAPLAWYDWKTMFLPFGAIIFSLWGVGMIPEIEEMLADRKQLLKKVIVMGTLIPAVMYLLFIFLVLGISGSQTTESALVGLKNFLGPRIFSVALLIGLITTFTAFIAQGLLLKETLMYDMGVKEFNAWIITCITPLLLFLLGLTYFIPLISFIGGVLLGINGIFILLMYQKIGGRKMIIYPLVLVFILGMVYELVYFVK